MLARTAESIRAGLPKGSVDYSAMSPEELESEIYARLHPMAKEIGRDLVERYDFSSYRSMADVGGGSGGLSIAVAAACPLIRATVVDLPAAALLARRYLDEAGVPDSPNDRAAGGDTLESSRIPSPMMHATELRLPEANVRSRDDEESPICASRGISDADRRILLGP